MYATGEKIKTENKSLRSCLVDTNVSVESQSLLVLFEMSL